MKNKFLIALYIVKILLTAIMLFSAGMYLFDYPRAHGAFSRLGYPTYLIYPLAIAKLLGLLAIWTPFSKRLKEWAYAGFFFDLSLAVIAHLYTNDGMWLLSFTAWLLVLVAVFLEDRKLLSTNNK